MKLGLYRRQLNLVNNEKSLASERLRLGPHFVDESDTNKEKFRSELTFQRINGTQEFCPVHAKCSFQHFRLHIGWPITKDSPVFLAYFGPKITKS
jgi:hypothetical protein